MFSCVKYLYIPFVEARNYFVSNQVNEVPSNIDNRADFEHYFGTATYMGKNGAPTGHCAQWQRTEEEERANHIYLPATN